ncbi:hypothetical protein [Wohlfahrtiimonas populi]|uniref:hypothetical protein n=1 Tax=Wohlfahrtiimonas populi TaxID=1940240 RepID=UPI00098D3FF0|nr:hypothetical protein [Wohlfahrtiimonas populi]
MSRAIYSQKFPEQCQELLQFAFDHIFEIDQRDRRGNVSELSELIDSLSALNIPNNIFQQDMTNSHVLIDSIDHGNGRRMVRVIHRPKDKPSFLFGKDSFGQDFFLHYENLVTGSWKDWCQISIGQNLFIQFDDEDTSDGKAIKASHIFWD